MGHGKDTKSKTEFLKTKQTSGQRFWLTLSAFIFVSLISVPSNAAYSTRCLDHGGYKSCETVDPQSTNPDTAYFFHGVGGSERSLDRGRETAELRDGFEKLGHTAPRIISVSFGAQWLLAERNPSPQSGLFERMINEVLPTTETAWGRSTGRRLLIGLSMGGFNASQILLKRPDLFERYALLCPAISSISIYARSEIVDAFIARTGAVGFMVRFAIGLSQSFFPDEASWATGWQMLLGETHLGPSTPPTYISCGSRDEFGFFEGNQLLADIAHRRGVPELLWQPFPGEGHCAYDGETVARFLLTR